MFKWMYPRMNAEGGAGAPASDPGVRAATAPSDPTPAAGDTSQPATPSVAAGDDKAPGAGNAPTPSQDSKSTAGDPPAAQDGADDVTKQASFAARLREEKMKLEAAYQPYKQQASTLEKIAQAAGFSDVGQYLQALEAHVQEQMIAAEAQRLQVDPDTYKQYFAPVKEELQRTKTELETLRQAEIQRQVKADYDRLAAKYPDFVELQDQVFEIAAKYAIPLEAAYKLAIPLEERINAAKLAGQQEAIKKLQENAGSTPGAVGGDAPNQQFDFTKLSFEERQKYYEKAKRGELKSLS